MPSRPSVAIVILNWNGMDLLREFLPSVVEYSVSEKYSCRVYVADNASTDGSADFVENAWADRVTVIRNEANYGYAKGYNECLKSVIADYFVLLNSDVEVTAGWIDPVIDVMEADDTVAACQPKLLTYRERDTFEYAGAAGGYLDKFGYPFCRGRIFDSFEHDTGQYEDPVDIFWASGAALFIRAELFKRSGGFEDAYFAHMEEIDLCWRLHRMGYRIRSVPASVVYHLGAGTLSKMNPRKTYLNFRNNRLLITKHIERRRFLPIFLLRNFLDMIAFFQSLFYGNFRESTAILQALIDYHLLLPKWMKKRRDIKKRIEAMRLVDAAPVPIYHKSIVFLYFVKGIKKFSELP